MAFCPRQPLQRWASEVVGPGLYLLNVLQLWMAVHHPGWFFTAAEERLHSDGQVSALQLWCIDPS